MSVTSKTDDAAQVIETKQLKYVILKYKNIFYSPLTIK